MTDDVDIEKAIELKDAGGFPIASAVVDVRSLAHTTGKFAFGLDKARVAEELRHLADVIENDGLLLQSAQVLQKAQCDEFVIFEFCLGYAVPAKIGEADE